MQITKLFFTLSVAIVYLATFVVGINCASAFATNSVSDVPDTNPKALIAAFIEGEFNGTPDMRQSYTAFTNHGGNRAVTQLSPTVSNGGVISLVSDPLVIVKKYVVGEVVVSGDKAFAIVTFDVIAKTKGHGLPGRTIYPVQEKQELVRYLIRRNSNRWRILDPLIPHVSLQAIRGQYEGEVQAMSKVITDPRASNSQKHVYETLEIELRKIAALQASK